MPVVPWRDRTLFRPAPFSLGVATSIALAISVVGCSTMSQDVHEYYSTMAQNYDDAAEKTKMQIVTLKSKAREMIQVGQIAKAKKIQHEINKVEDWQIKCYKERDRFAKAAQDLEKKDPTTVPASGDKKAADKRVGSASGATQDLATGTLLH